MLGKGPESRGNIQAKIYLPTQATIYTKADGPCTVTPYKCLGKISDNLHPNNQNNQLERRAQPPRDVS